MSKIYQGGYNLIYEQMKSDSEPSTSGPGAIDLVSAIYNYIVNTILLPSGLDTTDTPEEFDSLTRGLQNAKDLNTVKNEMLNLFNMGKLSDADKKTAGDYINTLFDMLMKVDNVNSKTDDIIAKIKDLVASTKSGIKDQMTALAANESLINEAGRVPMEYDYDDSEDDEDDPSEKEYVQIANRIMDAAQSFKDELNPSILDSDVAKDPGISDLRANADALYSDAKSVQVPRRRKRFLGIPGKIVTASGENMKMQDFKIKCTNILRSIERHRETLNQIKSKYTKIPAPPPVTPAPATVNTIFSTSAASAATPTSDTKQEAKAESGSTSWPIPRSSQFREEVQKLQRHLMERPTLKNIISKHGSDDGKFGKYTSKIANIVYGTITKNPKFESSVLTQDMYDKIMAFSMTGATNEGKSLEKIKSDKILEAESKRKSLLDFNAFDKAITKYNKVLEQSQSDLDLIDQKVISEFPEAKTGTSGTQNKTGGTQKTSPTETTQTDENQTPPTRGEWAGFKYVVDGTYPVPFDESLSEFWTKEIITDVALAFIPGGKFAVKAGMLGLRELTVKGASLISKEWAEKMAAKLAERSLVKKGEQLAAQQAGKEVAKEAEKKLAKEAGKKVAKETEKKVGASAWREQAAKEVSKAAEEIAAAKNSGEIANGVSKAKMAYFKAYGKIPIAKRATIGTLGAISANILKFLGGRDTVQVVVNEGFIDPLVVKSIATGMINTLDGYVSGEDLESISFFLSVIKGAWTVDDGGKAVSAWGRIKSLYQTSEKKTLEEDVKDIGTMTKFGDVKVIKLGLDNPLNADPVKVSYSLALEDIKNCIKKLDANESALASDVAKLPASYVKVFVDGNFEEIDVDKS